MGFLYLFKAPHSCCPPSLAGAPIWKGILQPQVGQVSVSHLLSQGPRSQATLLEAQSHQRSYPGGEHAPTSICLSIQLGLPWSYLQKRSHEETGKLCWKSFPQLVHEALRIIKSESFGVCTPRKGATERW